MIAGSTAT